MPKNDKDDLLKKIIGLIFEDVPEDENDDGTSEEVILEAPVVEHTIKEKVVKPEVKPQAKPQVKLEPKLQKLAHEEVKPQATTEAVKKTSFGINLNEKPEVKPQAAPKEIEEPIISKYKTITPRYEFKPTISPMFGVVSSDDEKIDKSVSMAGNVNDGNDSKIGTIFSPYYGVIEPHKAKEEAKFTEVENFPEVTKIGDNSEAKEETKSVDPKVEELLSPISENLMDNKKYEDKAVEDVLAKPNDETYVVPETISLFDDLD